MNEYTLTYMTAKTIVTVDDNEFTYKIGITGKKSVPIDKLKMLYIKQYTDYSELIIRFEKEPGKEKTQKFMFHNDQAPAHQFANDLVMRKPEIDLRGLDSSEAMKKIKAVNSQRVAFVVAPLIIIVIFAIGLLPGFIHFFDNGYEVVTADEIIEGKDLSTRNLAVDGYLHDNGMWEETTTTSKGSTTKTVKYYYPVIGQSYADGDPIHLIVETPDLTDDQFTEIFNAQTFDATLRNVLWEGPGSDQLDFFVNEYGMEIADDVMLLELNTDGSKDYWVLIVMGIVILIMGTVTIIMAVKQKKDLK